MWRELNAFGCLRKALAHIQTTNALGPSAVLDAHSTVSAGVRNRSVHLGSDTRVLSSHLSTQVRRTQT